VSRNGYAFVYILSMHMSPLYLVLGADGSALLIELKALYT